MGADLEDESWKTTYDPLASFLENDTPENQRLHQAVRALQRPMHVLLGLEPPCPHTSLMGIGGYFNVDQCCLCGEVLVFGVTFETVGTFDSLGEAFGGIAKDLVALGEYVAGNAQVH